MNTALKTAIIQTGLKQYQIAKLLDWSESKLSRIVIEAKTPTTQDKKEISELLEKPMETLFPGNNE